MCYHTCDVDNTVITRATSEIHIWYFTCDCDNIIIARVSSAIHSLLSRVWPWQYCYHTRGVSNPLYVIARVALAISLSCALLSCAWPRQSSMHNRACDLDNIVIMRVTLTIHYSLSHVYSWQYRYHAHDLSNPPSVITRVSLTILLSSVWPR